MFNVNISPNFNLTLSSSHGWWQDLIRMLPYIIIICGAVDVAVGVVVVVVFWILRHGNTRV